MIDRRYEMNLATVREVRLWYVANGDLARLQDMTVKALTFAYLSIHNRVRIQESWYAQMVAGTFTPRGLPAHKAAFRADDLVREHMTDVSLWEGDNSERIVRMFASFPYLAATKATFCAALLGYMDAPCLDMHMCKRIGIKSAPADVGAYRAITDACEINTTLAQWRAYETVDEYKKTQHDVYFRSVLGSRAYTATLPTQMTLAI